MISTIEIHGPATFTAPTTLTTSKKINLIYGLNGSGKSTICRFLSAPDLEEFKDCKLAPAQSATLYVYNEDFVRENFFESETLKGIFSLSKENKDAEKKIDSATREKAALAASLLDAKAKKGEMLTALQRAKQTAEDALWEIKADYAGGDRVLEFCLEGLKGKKETLFNYVASIPKKEVKPSFGAEQLKIEAQALSGQDAQPSVPIPPLSIDVHDIEADAVFETPIVGSQHSAISTLIQKLGNSDWVREGLKFAEHPDIAAGQCPFCQSQTITQHLLSQIRDFFDESYQAAVERVRSHLDSYQNALDKIPASDHLKDHPFINDKLLLLVEQLRGLVKGNLSSITRKAQSPASEIALVNSSALISQINEEMDEINEKVHSHNEKLRNKTASLNDIKTRFWDLMRWNYDHVIARYTSDKKEKLSAIEQSEALLLETSELVQQAEITIAAAQKETVNIDQAIANINQALLELGIDDFSIGKHDETLYRLTRTNGNRNSKFSTLSEGEKLIITLLYFCELCKGRRSATDTADEKIVVFDDPISSLSHLYVFNVGQLLRSTFFKTTIATQVFVFTHSLYFFYELTDPNHDRRKDQQALFRISKSRGRSQIVEMKYDEIQNDYQAYWQVVADSSQHPALIANCMRNIVDYFFNFVAKLDFNNVFQQPSLKANKFQAFSRYMNRESHSFGQNIYDLKEFDHDVFKEGLKLVFEELGYGEHYKKMISL